LLVTARLSLAFVTARLAAVRGREVHFKEELLITDVKHEWLRAITANLLLIDWC
jgi:hypothetical protein